MKKRDLEAKIADLEAQVAELERELEIARQYAEIMRLSTFHPYLPQPCVMPGDPGYMPVSPDYWPYSTPDTTAGGGRWVRKTSTTSEPR